MMEQSTQDLEGESYEYMLEKLNQSGRTSSPCGMVQMTAPRFYGVKMPHF